MNKGLFSNNLDDYIKNFNNYLDIMFIENYVMKDVLF
jgi:hypothetical protein